MSLDASYPSPASEAAVDDILLNVDPDVDGDEADDDNKGKYILFKDLLAPVIAQNASRNAPPSAHIDLQERARQVLADSNIYAQFVGFASKIGDELIEKRQKASQETSTSATINRSSNLQTAPAPISSEEHHNPPQTTFEKLEVTPKFSGPSMNSTPSSRSVRSATGGEHSPLKLIPVAPHAMLSNGVGGRASASPTKGKDRMPYTRDDRQTESSHGRRYRSTSTSSSCSRDGDQSRSRYTAKLLPSQDHLATKLKPSLRPFRSPSLDHVHARHLYPQDNAKPSIFSERRDINAASSSAAVNPRDFSSTLPHRIPSPPARASTPPYAAQSRKRHSRSPPTPTSRPERKRLRYSTSPPRAEETLFNTSSGRSLDRTSRSTNLGTPLGTGRGSANDQSRSPSPLLAPSLARRRLSEDEGSRNRPENIDRGTTRRNHSLDRSRPYSPHRDSRNDSVGNRPSGRHPSPDARTPRAWSSRRGDYSPDGRRGSSNRGRLRRHSPGPPYSRNHSPRGSPPRYSRSLERGRPLKPSQGALYPSGHSPQRDHKFTYSPRQGEFSRARSPYQRQYHASWSEREGEQSRFDQTQTEYRQPRTHPSHPVLRGRSQTPPNGPSDPKAASIAERNDPPSGPLLDITQVDTPSDAQRQRKDSIASSAGTVKPPVPAEVEYKPPLLPSNAPVDGIAPPTQLGGSSTVEPIQNINPSEVDSSTLPHLEDRRSPASTVVTDPVIRQQGDAAPEAMHQKPEAGETQSSHELPSSTVSADAAESEAVIICNSSQTQDLQCDLPSESADTVKADGPEGTVSQPAEDALLPNPTVVQPLLADAAAPISNDAERDSSPASQMDISPQLGATDQMYPVPDLGGSEAPAPESESFTASNAIDDDTEDIAAQDAVDSPVPPLLPVPGLWSVKAGRSTTCLVSFTFDIDAETATRYGISSEAPDSKAISDQAVDDGDAASLSEECLRLDLLCLPMVNVAETYKGLPRNAPAEEVASAVSAITPCWPKLGTLTIEVNSDRAWGRRWLARHLNPEPKSIEVTPFVRAGTNTVRLIQLGDHSAYIFVLHASRDEESKNYRLLDRYLATIDTCKGVVVRLATGTHVLGGTPEPDDINLT